MQELEKILEEMKESSITVATSKEHYIHPQDGRFVEEVVLLDDIEKIIHKHMNDGWIPVEKYGLPKDEGVYDLTIIDGRGIYDSVRWQFLEGTHLSGTQHYVDGVHYWADNYQGNPINEFLSERVIAWRKKPEAYRPERSEK